MGGDPHGDRVVARIAVLVAEGSEPVTDGGGPITPTHPDRIQLVEERRDGAVEGVGRDRAARRSTRESPERAEYGCDQHRDQHAGASAPRVVEAQDAREARTRDPGAHRVTAPVDGVRAR